MPLELSGDIAGLGKVVQIVRAADSTQRSTTSTSYVDVTGMSVTITPQKSDSAVLVIATFNYAASHGTSADLENNVRITDADGNNIPGAELAQFRVNAATRHNTNGFLLGYSTPATTSATTYKMQFRVVGSGTIFINNQNSTGQLFAIEVAA